jgi:hypothetical protein
MDGAEQLVLYVSAGIMPNNLLAWSTQTSTLRDAFFVIALKSDSSHGCVKTFAQALSTVETVDSKERLVLCEYTATMAYMSGQLNLAKEAILRVPPQHATSYIKTLYQAIALRKWTSETFNQAIANTSENALNMWVTEKTALNL